MAESPKTTRILVNGEVVIVHKLSLERLTDLCDYSQAQFGEDARLWPWYYTTDGIDIYEMASWEQITVFWQDEQAATLFLLKRGAEWKVAVQ